MLCVRGLLVGAVGSRVVRGLLCSEDGLLVLTGVLTLLNSMWFIIQVRGYKGGFNLLAWCWNPLIVVVTVRTSQRGVAGGRIMGMSQLHDVSDLAQFACTGLGMSVVPEREWGA